MSGINQSSVRGSTNPLGPFSCRKSATGSKYSIYTCKSNVKLKTSNTATAIPDLTDTGLPESLSVPGGANRTLPGGNRRMKWGRFDRLLTKTSNEQRIVCLGFIAESCDFYGTSTVRFGSDFRPPRFT